MSATVQKAVIDARVQASIKGTFFPSSPPKSEGAWLTNAKGADKAVRRILRGLGVPEPHDDVWDNRRRQPVRS